MFLIWNSFFLFIIQQVQKLDLDAPRVIKSLLGKGRPLVVTCALQGLRRWYFYYSRYLAITTRKSNMIWTES